MVGGGLLIIIGLIVLIFYLYNRKGRKPRTSWSTEESSEGRFSTKGLNLPKPNSDMNEQKQLYSVKDDNPKPLS